MTRQRQGIWKAASYAVLLLILGYIALLMIYVSGSNRSFSEMESSMEKVIDNDRNEETGRSDAQAELRAEQYRL